MAVDGRGAARGGRHRRARRGAGPSGWFAPGCASAGRTRAAGAACGAAAGARAATRRQAEVVRERLRVYAGHAAARGVLRRRPTFRSVDGDQPPDAVAADIAAAVASVAGGRAR